MLTINEFIRVLTKIGLTEAMEHAALEVPKGEAAGSFDWLMMSARQAALALVRSREIPRSAKSP